MTWHPLNHLQPSETHVATLRRHWLVQVGILIVGIALLLVPVGIYVFLRFSLPQWLELEMGRAALMTVLVAYVFAVWLFVSTEFIDYYLDTWVITTGRIINAEQHGLFTRMNSELNLSSIQDVTSETRGPIQTFFHYGTVRVQTAGTTQFFLLKQIPHPEEVKETIMKLAEADRLREGAR